MNRKVNIEELLGLWNKGLTREQIAKILKVHVATVSKHLNSKLDYIERRHSKDKLIHLDMNKVKELREKGYTSKEIETELNISDSCLYLAGMSKFPFKRKGIHTYSKDLEFFNKIDSSEKAYIIGFLLTDGSINKRGNISIEIKSEDDYILQSIRDLICPNKPIPKSIRTRTRGKYTWTSETSRLNIKSVEYIQPLSNFGIVPNKTYKDIQLPKLDEKYMPDLIRGIFDGDGSIWSNKTRNRGHAVNFTGNYVLLKDIFDYLKSNNIIKANTSVKKKPHQADSYFVFSSKKDVINFGKYIYSTNCSLYLKRKYLKFVDAGLPVNSMNCWDNLKAS